MWCNKGENLWVCYGVVGALGGTSTDEDDTMDAPVDRLATDDVVRPTVVWNRLQQSSLLLNSALNWLQR